MPENVVPVSIEEEMKRSYMEYAMSVIIGRALPDVRDGLKPVQRRILYAMYDMGLGPTKPYRKSARIVGDVLGKYHPHGDAAVYDAMVRMAQDFTLRYPLIDGQGNFGSVDGDPPAAMRYTEARLAPIAMEMLQDIEKDTVDFVPNFDGSLEEPSVLPAKLPNLLVNGASGIAVGMATNIPPHNLREVIEACCALLEDPDLSVEDLMEFIPGPDFPTGGIICGRAGIESAYRTGRGVLQIRAKVFIEQERGRSRIVITELPYQVNKARLVEKIAELAQSKKVEGIAEVRDESDREGLRVVVELRKDEAAEVILNQLYKLTPLQVSYGIIMLALVEGRPVLLDLKGMILHFLEHRKEVVRRRSLFELREAERRAHILEGFLRALDVIDEIIALIKASETPLEAKGELMRRFQFSEVQAQAILEMRLQRLTGLERDKISDEFEEVSRRILRLKEILSSERVLEQVVAEELREIAERFGDERRTEIVDKIAEIRLEDLIADEEVVVTITHSGYIKRTPADQYRRQRRGGKGRLGVLLKDGDFVEEIFVASARSHILFFTDRGRAYGLRVHEIPQMAPSAKGKAMVNLLRLERGEMVTAVVPVGDFSEGHMVLATRKGMVKRTPLEEFRNARSNGIKAVLLQEGDRLVGAKRLNDAEEILLGTKG
ncbi:MAG TPA: DNA gyrase subunit A, partial [Deltaproteobacteria bacterium]|nr:DNA gyrase subunit A [Deltaproteobacteria bacterium]